MSTESPERQLGEFVGELDYSHLPSGVVDTVSHAFVDTIGVTLAGAVTGAGEVATRTIGVDPTTAKVATLFGLTAEERPETTAFRLATAGHALDYDDVSWALDGHPSVTLVPPLLALADEADADGHDLITAYAAGFEVECAIAGPVIPAHYKAGWHATSTFGTFGATAAAAHLLDLGAATTRQALNVAASMPSGMKRNFGSMTKPLHAGLCSRSGVTAALLAKDGLTADATAISGEGGFWDLYSPEERDVFTIGDSWALETEGIHVKAYPCCYFTHTSIAATQALVEDDINPNEIERIEVQAAGGAAGALIHPEPETGLEAKFSMEHAVACAALREQVGLEAFEAPAIKDSAIASLRERVDFTVDDRLAYTSHEATVRIVTPGGTHERRQENPPGTHDNPLTDDELRAKFEECAGQVLSVDQSAQLYDMLISLSSISDVSAKLAWGH